MAQAPQARLTPTSRPPGPPPAWTSATPSSICAFPPRLAAGGARPAHLVRLPPRAWWRRWAPARLRAALPDAAPAAAPQTPDRANWYAPPFKVFDNLYWLGTRQHSSWALQTSAGIIIIDTNFAWATEPEIIDGLTKLGLKPRDIKYVIISHAHGDHDQGAAELQKRYGAQGRHGRGRLGVDPAAPGDRRGRRADARHRRSGRTA